VFEKFVKFKVGLPPKIEFSCNADASIISALLEIPPTIFQYWDAKHNNKMTVNPVKGHKFFAHDNVQGTDTVITITPNAQIDDLKGIRVNLKNDRLANELTASLKTAMNLQVGSEGSIMAIATNLNAQKTINSLKLTGKFTLQPPTIVVAKVAIDLKIETDDDFYVSFTRISEKHVHIKLTGNKLNIHADIVKGYGPTLYLWTGDLSWIVDTTQALVYPNDCGNVQTVPGQLIYYYQDICNELFKVAGLILPWLTTVKV
jgi:hypothetical protein